MSDSDLPTPASGTGGLARVGEWAYERKWKHYRSQAAPKHNPRTVADVATVLGIAEDAISDGIHHAVDRLVDELERLRWECEQSEHQLAWLHDHAERHSLVDCFNRRGFMGELSMLLLQAEQTGMQAVLGLIHVGGLETIRLTWGLEAVTVALRHIHRVLVECSRQTDVIGLLGEGDFAVIFTLATLPDARFKLDQVTRKLNEPPFSWQDHSLHLEMRSGMRAFTAGEDAETSLRAVDLVLRGGAKSPG